MQRLTWAEIKNRAQAFAEDWQDAHYEKGETQSFYNDFFEIFGVKRRQVAVYEQRVKLLNNKHGFMDLFWPGTLLIEQKSSNLDLDRARGQALDYVDGLKENLQPQYILTCDFQRWRLLDLETGAEKKFTLAELPQHIEEFAFILGRRRNFGTLAPVNIKAAELMGRLHDALFASGYTGHDLERLLVQTLFCLFADKTGIFEPKDIFLQLIDADTKADGSDTGRTLMELFDVLNTEGDARQHNLSGELKAFPYINGELFADRVRTPIFDKAMREMLLDAARFDWGQVSPAIFGSLFQSVMDAKERRAAGAHYTSETNIMKVIGPLFLDDLKAELERIKARKSGKISALQEYQNKLARLTFFDPACGCGNFLVVAYREVRALELAALEELYPKAMTGTGEVARQGFTDLGLLARVNVGQFYGIEIGEFPARIAEVAMWMTDHLANNDLSAAFSVNYARIPLRESAHITHGDALELDWNAVLPATQCHYVFGNPPFIGAKLQTEAQRAQVRRIAGLGGSGGTLDYVAAWFIKAGQYLGGYNSPSTLGEGESAPKTQRHPGSQRVAVSGSIAPQIPPVQAETWMLKRVQHDGDFEPTPNRKMRIAFVSTNSISQGEQVAQLWPILFDRHKLEIAFAHRTFAWGSEAPGAAHVHVVVIGLTHRDNEQQEKRLFSYPDIKSAPLETQHKALTAYLFDAQGVTNRHLVVKEEVQPINGAPKLIIGSKPIDGGYLIFDSVQRAQLIEKEPMAAQWLRPYVGAEEYVNGGDRSILALQSASPDQLRKMPAIMECLKHVREYRSGIRPAKKLKPSTQPKTVGISSRALAETPTAYHVTVIPTAPFLVIPEVSTERRDYIPIGWLKPPTIPSNLVRIIADATLYDFALLTSRAHMAWLAAIGGRLASSFRYSIGIVYNSFPWPEATPAQRTKIEALAQAVLDARAVHTTSSLADLYDPDTMPANLRKAHHALDAAVDKLYRATPFASDRDRVEHLFGRYEALVNPMEREAVKQNKRIARKAAKRQTAP